MNHYKGLSSQEVEDLLKQYGPNTLVEKKESSILLFLKKFWNPIPWLLEIIIILQISLGKIPEACFIVFLLLFNAILSFFQEHGAHKALQLLKKKLPVQAQVLRDQIWKIIAAEELVPGDILRLKMGNIIPADVQILDGYIMVDQSTITGESLPKELSSKDTAYAASIVKKGEAFAKVLLTGNNSFYGKTAEIVHIAKAPSHLEAMIFSIVNYLVSFDLALISFTFFYSLSQGINLLELAPFSLLLLIASVPVALPATYALATALGSIELTKKGVLVSRLKALEEAAAMDVLCVDKTGTITQNTLKVSKIRSYLPFTDNDLLYLASLACEEATQDPLDLAILQAAQNRHSPYEEGEKTTFIPFDPKDKYSKALMQYQNKQLQVLKGAPSQLFSMLDKNPSFNKEVEILSEDGSRVLAVILGNDKDFAIVGLIALKDPLREDSKSSIQEIENLGLRVIMLTGDSVITSKAIGQTIGLQGSVLTKENLPGLSEETLAKSDIIAGVFPEDKFHIIQTLQEQGHISGMTGDGVNDAPSLKKAEVGIAVNNATDVAKASASLVLTKPGLLGIIEAIKSSRRIYQRMLTYTLNKIIKTLEISVLLSLGLIFTHQFIISTLLIVLLLFLNDFVTMSISTDRVSFSLKPDKWEIKKFMITGCFFAICILALSFFILWTGLYYLHLPIEKIQTLIFLTLVFTGHATIYLIRERGHFWHSRPSFWMILSSVLAIAITSFFAIRGLFMASLPLSLVFCLLVLVIIYFVFLDFLKTRVVKFF